MLLRTALGLCLAFGLTACGGGGGGSAAPAPAPAPNSAPSANAGAAQTLPSGSTASLDGGASTDAEGSALTYSWVLTSKPATSAATLGGAATAKPSFVADVPGNYVLSLTVSDGQLSSTPSSVTVTAVSTANLAIKTDKPDLVTGTVQLSLSDSSIAAPVTWFVDKDKIGTGAALSWDSGKVSNTPHQLLARIQMTGGNAVDVQRKVTVANSGISLLTATRLAMTPTFFVVVHAESAAGVASVSGSVDGVDQGTLLAPNDCDAPNCPNGLNRYALLVDPRKVGSGSHVMLITAVDLRGNMQQIEMPLPISNGPSLTLKSPASTSFVYGKLDVEGSYASDKATAATVTAKLNDDPKFFTSTTTEKNFKFSYDGKDRKPGMYYLWVQAEDVDGKSAGLLRSVVFASSPDLVYSPVATLAAFDNGLVVDGNQLLYAQPDQTLQLLDLGTGTRKKLVSDEPVAYGRNWQAGDWQISSGHVFGPLGTPDCALQNYGCMQMWRPDGTRVNLTAGAAVAGTQDDRNPVARAGYVAWQNTKADGSLQYVLYEVATGKYSVVAPPAGTTVSVTTGYDLTVKQGVAYFFYSASTSSGAVSQDVYRWSSNTGASTRLSTAGSQQSDPRVDGDRVIWSYQGPAAGSGDPYALFSMPVTGGSATRLVSSAKSISKWQARGGLLSWVEGETYPSCVIKAMTSTGSTSTIAEGRFALIDSDGSNVAFANYDAGATSTWNAVTRKVTRRMDVDVEFLGWTITGGSLVGQLGSVMGNEGSVYRIPLN